MREFKHGRHRALLQASLGHHHVRNGLDSGLLPHFLLEPLGNVVRYRQAQADRGGHVRPRRSKDFLSGR